jgi:hypothetical protein
VLCADRLCSIAKSSHSCVRVVPPGNRLQVWRKRSDKEAQKKARRRIKRAMAKGKDAEEAGKSSQAPAEIQVSDMWEAFVVHREDSQIRSFSFLPVRAAKPAVCKLAVLRANNGVTCVVVMEVCRRFNDSLSVTCAQGSMRSHLASKRAVL